MSASIQANTIQANTIVRPAVVAKVQPANKDIILDLSNPTTILFTITASGEASQRVLHDGIFTLTKGLVYKLPITNKDLSTKNNFGIKHELETSNGLRILNVDNGVVTIETIVHGFVLIDKQLLGSLF